MKTEKLQATKDKILQWVNEFVSPAIMWSGGKDSTVMLHICRKLGLKLPVIFHRHPWMPEKNRFIDNLIYSWGLMIYDWPPAYTAIKHNKEMLEPNMVYQIGEDAYMAMPVDLIPMESGKKYVCARFDILGRPTGTFRHPWDMVMIGHKNTDTDPYYGNIPLKDSEYRPSNGPAMTFPLREWTDDDIWDYTEEHKVPVARNRYDVKNRTEYENKNFNPDYVRACSACVDPRNPAKVFCPLLGREIDNVSSSFPDISGTKFAYIDH